jgi:hypothetical protein
MEARPYDLPRRASVFDKLKQWLAGESPQTLRVARRTVPATRGRRAPGPERPRPAPDLGERDSPDARALVPGVVEQVCPNCGQPMLASWGSSCGNCRPAMAAPKTLYLAASAVQGLSPTPGLSLGWFVVLQSPDEQRRGTLIELTAPISVLSRGRRRVATDAECFDINDDFMSGGHASVHRPRGSERGDSFTIRDREEPSPSANGTFVNSHKLGPGEVVQLSEGDIIRLGTTELIFKSLWLPPGVPGLA